MKETLLQLLNTPGVSGYETIGGISQLVSEIASTVPGADVETDGLGNVLVKIGTGKKKILIEAHIDEVGFLVSNVLSETQVQLLPVGGIHEERVRAASVCVVGREKTITARVENNFVASVESTASIQAGDWCYFERNVEQQRDSICSPALDNRVSCAVLLELLRTMATPDKQIYFLFATQHELGSSVSILDWLRKIGPDFTLICDSAYAQPNGEDSWNIPELGKGPAIQLMGTDFVVNGKIAQQLRKIAENKEIPYQLEIPAQDAGGTDASKIPNSFLFGIVNTPVRNQHTGEGQANLQDLENCARLLRALLTEMDI